MSSNQYYDDGEDEAAEAQDRIDRILSGGGSQGTPQTNNVSDDPLGGAPRVELRSRAARSALGLDQQEDYNQQRQRSGTGRRAPAGKARQAIIVIGGVLLIGVVVVIVIFLLAGAAGGGGMSLPFFATATPTATATSTATATPTPTATVPPLQLPNLTCLVQSTVGCLDYCQNIDNLRECDQARAQVETQGADFTVFLKCVAPISGPNTGNPQTCLEDAYRAKHP